MSTQFHCDVIVVGLLTNMMYLGTYLFSQTDQLDQEYLGKKVGTAPVPPLRGVLCEIYNGNNKKNISFLTFLEHFVISKSSIYSRKQQLSIVDSYFLKWYVHL